MQVPKKVSIPATIAASVLLLFAIAMWVGGIGYNDDHEWQVLVYPSGTVRIVDSPGYYMKWFGTAKTWPRAMQFNYSNIRVTFNDGGTADTTGTIRVQLPTSEDMRRTLNQEFSANPENLALAINAHLTNVIKATGPTMSASEHQSARKAEFQQLVFEQTAKGIYRMKRIEKEITEEDFSPPVPVKVDPNNPQIVHHEKVRTRKVMATEIITDDKTGEAVIGQPSPLTPYEINIVQISVGDVDYDPKTRDLFEAKKESFLAAEQSKAERMQEYEETLMVQQKGLREKAEAEAAANVIKATAVITAEQAAEVALQEQVEAETKAQTLVKVSEQTKEAALIKANQELEVAELGAQAAEQEAKAIITLATAEEEKIVKAGAITEETQVLAEIMAKRDVEVAKALSAILPPQVVMGGGQNTNGQGDFKDSLISMHLLKQLGLLDGFNLDKVREAAIKKRAGNIEKFDDSE